MDQLELLNSTDRNALAAHINSRHEQLDVIAKFARHGCATPAMERTGKRLRNERNALLDRYILLEGCKA